MCLVVDADLILANLLVAGKESVTIRDLAKIGRKLEAIKGRIFIDVAVDSVLFAVEKRPDMFMWDGCCVRKAENADFFKLDYVDDCFNLGFPSDVVEVIRESAA